MRQFSVLCGLWHRKFFENLRVVSSTPSFSMQYYSIIIDKSFGTVGRLLLPGHSYRPNEDEGNKESMPMFIVNYHRVNDREHYAAYRNES